MTVSPKGPEETRQHNFSKRSLRRNVVFSYLATFSSMFAGFLVTPVLFRTLGEAEFGVYALVMALAGLTMLSDLGVGTSTIRRVAAATADGDDQLLAVTITNAKRIVRASGLATTTGLLTVAWFLPQVVDIPAQHVGATRAAMAIVALGQGVLIAWSTPTIVAVGSGRTDLQAKRSIFLGVATALVQCLVSLLGGGVVGVCTVVALSAVASSAIGIRLQARVLNRTLPLVKPSRHETADLLRESSANFALSLSGTVAFTSDAIILGAVGPVTAVGIYALASRLPNLIRTLGGKVTDLLVPTYSHIVALRESGPEAQRQLLAIFSRTAIFGTALSISGGLMACGSTGLILDVWAGSVPEGAVEVVWILSAAGALGMSGHAVFVLLTGLRRLRALVVYSAAMATVNLALSVWLSIEMGVTGPALATLGCVALGDLAIQPMLAARALGVRPFVVWRAIVLVPCLPALPAVGFLLAVRLPHQDVTSLVSGAGAVLIYLVLLLAIVGSEERRWFASASGLARLGQAVARPR